MKTDDLIKQMITNLKNDFPHISKDIGYYKENNEYIIYISNEEYFTSTLLASKIRLYIETILYKNNIKNFKIIYKRL